MTHPFPRWCHLPSSPVAPTARDSLVYCVRSNAKSTQSLSFLSQRQRRRPRAPNTSGSYFTASTLPSTRPTTQSSPNETLNLNVIAAVGQHPCYASATTAARPFTLPAMASIIRASTGGGIASSRSPHLYSHLPRSTSPEDPPDDDDEDEKGSVVLGGGYEYARRPPRTKRLLRLFLSTIFSSLLILLVGLALLPPRSRPKPLLEILAMFSGEDAHVYTTRSEYCSPIRMRNDEIGVETTGWDPLEREYWASSITGAELLNQEYPPRVVDGMVKIVHQSWKTHVVPTRFKGWSETWRKFNGEEEGWVHVIWSDEDNARLVREHYRQWEELYSGFETEIHRADFARNLYMHR